MNNKRNNYLLSKFYDEDEIDEIRYAESKFYKGRIKNEKNK